MTKYRCESVTDVASGKVYIEVFYPADSLQVFRTSPANFDTHEAAEREFTQFANDVLPDFTSLPADPDNQGWVLGFAVVKNSPWHFGGIYAQEEMAAHVAANLGGDYEVHYGSHKQDSDDFMRVSR